MECTNETHRGRALQGKWNVGLRRCQPQLHLVHLFDLFVLVTTLGWMRVADGAMPTRSGRLDRERLHIRQKKTSNPRTMPSTTTTTTQPHLDERKKLDLQGIEPWTTPMLREYYTTKPQARFLLDGGLSNPWDHVSRL